MTSGFDDSQLSQAEAALAHAREIAEELLQRSIAEAECAEGAAAARNPTLAAAYWAGKDAYMGGHRAVLSEIREHEAVVARLLGAP